MEQPDAPAWASARLTRAMLGKLNDKLQHILFIYRNSGTLFEKGGSIFLSETSLLISVFSQSGVGGFSTEDHDPHSECAASRGLASGRNFLREGAWHL